MTSGFFAGRGASRLGERIGHPALPRLLPALPRLLPALPRLLTVTLLGAASLGAMLIAAVEVRAIVSPAPGVAAPVAAAPAAARKHQVVILVDSDDDRVMRHAIGYAVNLNTYYADKGEHVAVEIVANGSGIKLFRGDTSPLQAPLAAVRGTFPNVTYSMCASSKGIAEAREGHQVSLLPGVRLVPFGIGRVIDLEEAGWSYVHA